MTETSTAAPAAAVRWTCPFCLLSCDHLGVRSDAAGRSLELTGGGCARAEEALARFGATPSNATPRVDGRACSLEEAVAATVWIFAASRQPLFGGLGADVAGARALYRLACATGAICDAAGGEAQQHLQRALQDRGAYTTTLAEVRARADLVVLLGGPALEQAPNLFDRLGLGAVLPRRVVVIDARPEDADALVALASRPDVQLERIELQVDLFSAVATLAALVARRAVRDAPAALVELAARLHAARYAVIVSATARLPEHGALVVEAVHRIVGTLNATTRAAALWLGGGDGAATVNQVFTWLSGLPLRSRAGPAGLEHEPLCFGTQRLLADGAVDALLWVASFGTEPAPPTTATPLVMLGHPAFAAHADRVGSVFIPVSTPGIGSAGHLFRTDGVVLMPLFPVYLDTLPTLAQVLDRIGAGLSR
jgi:formylmethanofuran dehydrogenase subunit B